MSGYERLLEQLSTPGDKSKRTWSDRKSPINESDRLSKIARMDLDQALSAEEKIDYLMGLVKSMDARLIRAEQNIEKLEDLNEQLTYRSMKNNLIVYRLAEDSKENCYAVAKDFLIKGMQIPKEKLSSDIVIDICHRIGRGKNRPLIIRFTTHNGRRLAMTYCKNLKGKNAYVREQLPPDMGARAQAQVDKFKKLKEETDKKVTLIRDKLFCEGEVVEPSFNTNEIIVDTNLSPKITFADIKKTDVKIKDTNSLVGLIYPAENFDEAKTALARVITEYKDADSIAYAYNLFEGDYGNSDNKEYGVSFPILKYLNQKKKYGIVMIVKYNGKKKLKIADRNTEYFEMSKYLVDQYA